MRASSVDPSQIPSIIHLHLDLARISLTRPYRPISEQSASASPTFSRLSPSSFPSFRPIQCSPSPMVYQFETSAVVPVSTDRIHSGTVTTTMLCGIKHLDIPHKRCANYRSSGAGPCLSSHPPPRARPRGRDPPPPALHNQSSDRRCSPFPLLLLISPPQASGMKRRAALSCGAHRHSLPLPPLPSCDSSCAFGAPERPLSIQHPSCP